MFLASYSTQKWTITTADLVTKLHSVHWNQIYSTKVAHAFAHCGGDYSDLLLAILPFISFITYITLFSRVCCSATQLKDYFLAVLVDLCDHMTKFWPTISKFKWYEYLIISIKKKKGESQPLSPILYMDTWKVNVMAGASAAI